VRFEGGTGLRARLGVSPEDLVRDIRAIAAAIRDKQPIPELAFVDHMAGVSDRTVLELLDIELDELLSSQKKAQAGLAVSVPEESLEDYRDARSVDIKIGSAPVFGVPEVTVEAIAARTSVQQPGTRVGALREGRIQLYADPYREERLSSANALKWIETTISLDERRYHLLDGEWLEFDGVYADGQDDLIKELMDGSGGIDLPAWQRGWREDEYLVFAAARTRMPCLDRKLARERAEEGRVAVRNVRRHAKSDIGKLENDGDITEDEHHRADKDLQERTDRHVNQIDQLLQNKERELLEV
jgi:uncharacterized protein (TIGR04141 family)